MAKDSPRSRRDPSTTTRVSAAVLVLTGIGCGERATVRPDPGAGIGAEEIVRARDLGAGRTPWSTRVEAAALVGAVEGGAVREGAGARAADLYAVAGRLAERTWRVGGNEHDGSWALSLYRLASRDTQATGACDAAVRADRLGGELVHDASTTYAELLETRRRFTALTGPNAIAASGCLREVDSTLSTLNAFRPAEPASELDRAGAVAAPIASAAVGAPRIVRIEAWPGPDSARVVVALDRPASYRIGDEVIAGTTTPQTFVELDGVDLGGAASETTQTGIVTGIRTQATSTGSRVILDFDGQVWRRTFHMVEPYRIVLDVARHPPFADRGLRAVSRVALDAGHGGRDTGAIGPGGSLEKEITLDIALRAARILEEQGFEVLLTRDVDRFVSLEERTARANAFSSDLFVSIHCNATEVRGRRGLETYVLDTTNDAIAAKIAARENATSGAATAELGSMLSSMRIADQAQRSMHFAHLLERSGLAALRMKYADTIDGGVHPAGFYVLTGARMPSALMESSYISNAIEEERLDSSDYRQLLADAIANAIKAYREGR